ncbi:hypothetical protein CALCODRAFT_132975 [Calocera cornea HHB12733]|uniref:Uncharacterized protein n=1 Tax=Calocera cornea HHB12733 TaxID=1353952 RepID=A0A165CW63_9BASI|nr:hypothetical protein CALCODRAFT_132975 [Calocera cornea HHB12733]
MRHWAEYRRAVRNRTRAGRVTSVAGAVSPSRALPGFSNLAELRPNPRDPVHRTSHSAFWPILYQCHAKPPRAHDRPSHPKVTPRREERNDSPKRLPLPSQGFHFRRPIPLPLRNCRGGKVNSLDYPRPWWDGWPWSAERDGCGRVRLGGVEVARGGASCSLPMGESGTGFIAWLREDGGHRWGD